jgi:hypothetical protein
MALFILMFRPTGKQKQFKSQEDGHFWKNFETKPSKVHAKLK